MARKQLVVNADDFGFTPDVNSGIVKAHREGILTATTLMANGDAFDDAVRLARETPSLDVGCHLVLIGGRSLLDGKTFPGTASQLVGALALRRCVCMTSSQRRSARSSDRESSPPTWTHTSTRILRRPF